MSAGGSRASAHAGRDAIVSAVARAQAAGLISPAQAHGYRAIEAAAVRTAARLGGVRRRELRSAVAIVRRLAARRALTPARMPFVFLTLQRNLEWWAHHGPPAPGSPGEPLARGRRCRPPLARSARVAFPGSGVVFEYYRGLGLQLQVNGTFGAVNAALKSPRPAVVAAAGRTLEEMRALAAPRAGALTWEYEFPVGHAQPPWTSALAQATAVEAYTRAAAVLHRPDYLEFARRLSALFERPAPVGVRLGLGSANWYLLYSFPPHQLVLNAHLDAVVALHDLAASTGDPAVARLEAKGLRAARARIGRFDTGRWSRYAQGGPPASLNYHALNVELAQALCQRTQDGAICGAAGRFGRELDRRCPRRGGSGGSPGGRSPAGPTGPSGASGPTGPGSLPGPIGPTGATGPGGATGPTGAGGPLPPIPPPPGAPALIAARAGRGRAASFPGDPAGARARADSLRS